MGKNLPLVEAISILVGTIIGAGILGIPYVVAQAGFLTGMVVLVVLSVAVILINLLLGEIVLSTQGNHQLTGYAEKYFGKIGKYLMFGSVVFGFYGALLAYIIGEGEALAALAGGSPLLYSLIFFAFASLLVYIGLVIIKRFEFFMTLAIMTIVIIITFLGASAINLDHLREFSLLKLFVPYGVIFFAIGGMSAIPQLRLALKGQEQKVKQAIIIGSVIPFVVYFIFTLLVVGVTGLKTTAIATIGLGQTIGEAMIIFGNLFAVFTMGTSFLTLGLALRDTYKYDLKISHFWAWSLACLVPLVVFLFGLHDFVGVIGTVGAVGGGLEGLLVLAIYLKLRSLKQRERLPEYQLSLPAPVMALLTLIFIGGMIFTFFNLS